MRAGRVLIATLGVLGAEHFAGELLDLETRAPWFLPHSLTVVCASTGANLYVPAVYSPGDGGFPAGRASNRSSVRDPHSRIRILGKLDPRDSAA